MRVSIFWYCLKQGIINICRNILFSPVSIVTTSTCILLFHLFFVLTANVQNVVKTAEITVGITVFSDEDMPEGQVLATGDGIRGREEVRETQYVSAAQTRENFKTDYFERMEELIKGFADDNPLSDSASYEIFLNNIEEQGRIVERLEGMEGVREMRYPSTVVTGLTSAGKMVGAMSATIICVLLAVAVFLISNTIFVATTSRRRENEIVHLINATNYTTCASLAVEGVLLGALGAVVPLAGTHVSYQRAITYISEHYQMLTGMFESILLGNIFPYIAATTGCLGVGIGLFVSYFTIHRHLKIQGRRM